MKFITATADDGTEIGFNTACIEYVVEGDTKGISILLSSGKLIYTDNYSLMDIYDIINEVEPKSK